MYNLYDTYPDWCKMPQMCRLKKIAHVPNQLDNSSKRGVSGVIISLSLRIHLGGVFFGVAKDSMDVHIVTLRDRICDRGIRQYSCKKKAGNNPSLCRRFGGSTHIWLDHIGETCGIGLYTW